MTRILILFSFFTFLGSCQNVNENYSNEAADPEVFHQSVKTLTDVIVHDIFSPPVASRIYVYASIAAYEIIRLDHPEANSLAGQIRHFENIPQPEKEMEYCFPLAATLAFLKTGKILIFSEDRIQSQIDEVLKYYKNLNMPDAVFRRSVQYADQVVNHIIEWSSKDNYKQSRSFPKYSIQKDPSTWKPTPPGYMDGIEPSWRTIRTFVIDSAEQFRPELPTQYDMNKNSAFYKEVMEVYESVKTADEEKIEIANFWDCNPYKLNVTGHVMHATKKITPGGHWINIVRVVCKKDNADLLKVGQTYALVSLALVDGFISCWDEKYRSNYIRPETVINEHIDPEWLPLLQTPPFPEYTSGHSVISSASAVVLTSIFGSDFSFVDDTELEFGLPERSFSSFYDASEEAAISRLYGGIHFRPAIENGVKQGKELGEFVVSKIKI